MHCNSFFFLHTPHYADTDTERRKSLSSNTGNQHADVSEMEDSTIPGSDLYLFPHRFGTFSISFSVGEKKFCSWGKKFNMASKKPVNACTLQWKYKPGLELPEFSAEATESAMQKAKLWQ